MAARKKSMADLAGTGDDGTTGLLGGGRAGKDSLRVDAYGTVDEASSAIGLARALCADRKIKTLSEELQRDLYRLGAELALPKGAATKVDRMTATDVKRVEDSLRALEKAFEMPREFILPGATPGSAALDLARTIVRRAERRCVALRRAAELGNPQVTTYLNRLSLLLFVMGRVEEARAGVKAKPSKKRKARIDST